MRGQTLKVNIGRGQLHHVHIGAVECSAGRPTQPAIIAADEVLVKQTAPAYEPLSDAAMRELSNLDPVSKDRLERMIRADDAAAEAAAERGMSILSRWTHQRARCCPWCEAC